MAFCCAAWVAVISLTSRCPSLMDLFMPAFCMSRMAGAPTEAAAPASAYALNGKGTRTRLRGRMGIGSLARTGSSRVTPPKYSSRG